MKPRVPDWLQRLFERPVAILGAGVSGRAAAGLIEALGGRATIFDREARDASSTHFGAEEAAQFGLVVVSPGFAPSHAWVQTARTHGCEVMSELDLGALAWPGEIIAVTGTNGKTTLTEFLVHALRSIGRDTRAVGNVGHAFSDAWKTPAEAGSIAVCEVSSFQAEQLRFFEAGASLWTNFAEDHLERHPTLKAYFRAKYRLVEHTRGREVYFGPSVRAHAHAFGFELPMDHGVDFVAQENEPRLEGTAFARQPQRENFLLARALWSSLGFEEEALLEAASSFALGPHRLARVRELEGVTYWNDSKATNFHAVEAALAGFSGPVIWVGGGRSKGGDLHSFATRIAPRMRSAFLIGETGAEMTRCLRDLGVPVVHCASLREAVSGARAAATAGEHVLLSPGFASFDMFNGYDDRGRKFEAIVAALTQAPPELPTSNLPNPANRPVHRGLCLL
ncbi:MAG: UDP-N-acetylmuramoyl-L-alanine--D-glutamate ligase [Opitutaceae bacterium]